MQFTVLARQILRSDRLNDSQVDDFTKELCRLLEIMPETLQFDPAWIDTESTSSQSLWSLRTIATGTLTNLIFLILSHLLENYQEIELFIHGLE